MTYSNTRLAGSGRVAIFFTVAIAVLAMATPNAMAGGMGFDLAYISPEGLDGTIGFGGFMNFGTPVTSLQIEPFAGYWSQSAGIPGAEASLSDFALGARGKYVFPLSSKAVEPFVGAGFGLHFLKASTDISLFGESTNLSVTDSELGVDLGGGINIPITPRFSLRGEGWYSFVGSSEWASARIGAMFSM